MNDVNFINNPFLKLCRVCTQQKQELNDLFTTFTHNNKSLAETLAHCTQKPIAVDDGLSAMICIDCIVNLIAVFEFQTLCAASETKVRQFLTVNSQKISPENNGEPTPADVDHCADTLDEIKDEILCNEKANIETNDTTNLRPIEDVGNNWRRKSFECLHCKKLFPKMYNLRRHIRIHDETGKPFECPVCRCRFSSANNSKRHAIKHTIDLAKSTTQLRQSTSFPCRLCERIFPKKESLASHMKIHKNNAPPDDATAKQRLSCEFCSKNFSEARQLMRHIRGHDEMKVLQCNICSKRFAHNGTLIDHMNRHNNIKPHQCTQCTKSFHQSSSLKEHLRTHNGATPYLCSQCGKVFNNRSNLRQHVIRHSDQKPYLCNQCPSRFSCRAGLRSHLSCHSGLKPHVCDTCGSTFTKASSLIKHNRIHSGIRPFPCEMCDMRFTCSDHLKRHKRTHTGEKPYKCKYCDRAFAQSNDLVKHTRIHVGENTYQCLLCTSAFRLQSELRAHATVHYQQSESTDHTYCTA